MNQTNQEIAVSVQPTNTRKEIAAFLGLTFGASVLLYSLILTSKSPAEGQRFIPELMWAPGLSALATRLIFYRTLRGLGWGWPGLRWAALACLLPIAYATVAYGVVWLTGLGGYDLSRFKDNPLLFVLVGLIVSLVLAAGEEIGWRGFLVPALARTMSLGRVALVSGAIWVVYHAPLILFGEYNASGNPKWYSMLCFTVMAMSVALMLAWLRLRTGSLWPAAILHAAHNLAIQGFFDRVTVDTGSTRWLTGEFGAALAVTTGVAAWMFWRTRGQVTVRDENNPA